MSIVDLSSITDSPTPTPSFTSTSIFTTTTTTTTTTTLEPPSLAAPSTGSPIKVILGALALIASLIIIIVSMAWWIFKRRWHRKNATHPKKPTAPSHPDLESQLQEDSDVEGATTSHPKQTAKRHTASSNPNTQDDSDIDASNVHYTTPSLTPHIPQVKTSRPNANNSDTSTRHTFTTSSPTRHTSTTSSPTRHTSTTSSSSRLLPPMPPSSPSVPTFSSLGNVLCPQGVDLVDKQPGDTHTDSGPTARLLPMDIHIDRVDMDMESLLPIVISDEIEPAAILRLQQQQLQLQIQLQQQKQDEVPTNETKPSIAQPTTATAMPPLRRPTFASRKSTDSCSSSRPRVSTSSSHPPPPPPPTSPPPAIPGASSDKHTENDCNQSKVSSEALAGPSLHDPTPNGQLAYTRGRHPRASTETGSDLSSSEPSVRRSISVDSSARWLEDQARSTSPKGRVSTSSQRSFQSIYPPPSTPPPPPPDGADLSQSPQSIQRRRHQKKPSQVLSPCFFALAESSSSLPALSPLSPLSPPLSPLAIQVPRPSSRALFHGPSSSSGRGTSGSATFGRASSESPVPRLTFTPKSTKTPTPAPQTPVQVQHRRARSRSISKAETYGLTPNAFPASSLVPELATSPPLLPLKQETMASATQSYLLLRRPSLVLNSQHQQSSLMNPPAALSEHAKAASSPASLVSTPVGSDPCHQTQRHRRRRSRSLSSWREHSSSSILSSSSTLEGHCQLEESPMSEQGSSKGDDEKLSVSSVRDSDQELQAIIADARVIAAAKCAAIKAARESARNRHSYYQRIYGLDSPSQQPFSAAAAAMSSAAAYTAAGDTGGLDRDHWGNIMPVSGPSTSSSSRAESPFYPQPSGF